ncbi:MAG: alpha/beta hydrolase [Sulfurospirillaceae bacterium]|nr:alpha/beta hydrolase [Sulfurospirillaceae bacterium]MDD2827840.1 alpha/beta hydrolase [Sulfurospirillaceae bacterium]
MKTKIYFLPGSMCNERLWDKLYTYFDEHYELVHVPIPMEDNFNAMADALLPYFKEEKINLFGFSMGGYLSAFFTVKYPHKVGKLFLAGSAPRSFPPEEIRKREEGLNDILNNGFRALSHTRIMSLLDKKNHSNQALIDMIQTMYMELGVDVLTKQIDAMVKRENLLMDIAMLHIPITFCYSKEDELISKLWLQIIAKQSKYAEFVEFEGGSHMLPLEKPLELSQEIKKWVNAPN